MATRSPPIPRASRSSEIAAATGGVAARRRSADAMGVAIDSRAVTEGCLFVAIRGEHHDGARFIVPAAAERRTCTAGSPGDASVPTASLAIEVADTTRALGDLAALHRQRWGESLIAITGSAGKTTTKELTAAALRGDWRARAQDQRQPEQPVRRADDAARSRRQRMTLRCSRSAPAGAGEIARLGEIGSARRGGGAGGGGSAHRRSGHGGGGRGRKGLALSQR